MSERMKPWRDLTTEEKINRHAAGLFWFFMWSVVLTIAVVAIIVYLIHA